MFLRLERAWQNCYPAVRTLLVIFCIAAIAAGCKAKETPYTFSSKTDYYNASKFERPTRYEPLALYTYTPNDYLVGNQCVTEYTKTLGFEYTYPFDAPNAKPNKLYSFSHNVWTHIRLTNRLGFGWKKRLKQRIKQCRASSGDFRG